MSEDYLAQQPLAIWSDVRGAWEMPTANLFCEHLELFSATWPAAGMMRDGQAFELPTQAHRITASASSSLPTVTTNGTGRHSANYDSLGTLQMLEVSQGILPREYDSWEQINGKVPEQWRDGKACDLLPTPNTLEHLPAREGEARERQLRRGGEESRRASSGNLREDILTLMPTTRTSMANGSTAKEREEGNPKARIETAVEIMPTNWGKFEPAIRRWEEVIGRSAPAPTKADGKDGAHRLSSAFTEWMMGLPEGWITDCGLTRNEELKACGNGVVPQQAELALRMLFAVGSVGSVGSESMVNDRIETGEPKNRPA